MGPAVTDRIVCVVDGRTLWWEAPINSRRPHRHFETGQSPCLLCMQPSRLPRHWPAEGPSAGDKANQPGARTIRRRAPQALQVRVPLRLLLRGRQSGAHDNPQSR